MIFLDNHEEVVEKCKGCQRAHETKRGGKYVLICTCCPYPRMEWLFGQCSRHSDRDDKTDPA